MQAKVVSVKSHHREIKENPLNPEQAIEGMKRNRCDFFLSTSAFSLSFARGKRVTGSGPTTATFMQMILLSNNRQQTSAIISPYTFVA